MADAATVSILAIEAILDDPKRYVSAILVKRKSSRMPQACLVSCTPSQSFLNWTQTSLNTFSNVRTNEKDETTAVEAAPTGIRLLR